jgi:hypothetical protein
MEKTAKGKISKFRQAHGLPVPSNATPQAAGMRVKRQSSKVPQNRSEARDTPAMSGASGAKSSAAGLNAMNSSSDMAKSGRAEASSASDAKKNPDEVTVDMKLALVNKVRLLQNEGLTKLVGFITNLMASSVSELEDDRLQIRVDDFDIATYN